MNKKIKEEKNIKFYINITYFNREGTFVQRFDFSVSNKRYLPLIYDKRYLFKKDIDELLFNEKVDSSFVRRIDEKDYIEVVYSKNGSHSAPRIATISNYVPPYTGCIFCKKAKKKGDFIFCDEKGKTYQYPGIKKCPVFLSLEKNLT